MWRGLQGKELTSDSKAWEQPIPYPARYSEAPVLQLKGNEFCNNHRNLKEDSPEGKAVQPPLWFQPCKTLGKESTCVWPRLLAYGTMSGWVLL